MLGEEDASGSNEEGLTRDPSPTSPAAFRRALDNCYRYLDMAEFHLAAESRGGEAAVAVNGREVREVVRDHLMAMLQIHIMDHKDHNLSKIFKPLSSRIVSKFHSTTIDQFRETLNMIAEALRRSDLALLCNHE